MTIKIAFVVCILIQLGCNERTAELNKKADQEIKIDSAKSRKKNIMFNADERDGYPEHWKWEDDASSFKLDLLQRGDSIVGKYCAIVYEGRKIDCSDDTASNFITGIKISDVFQVTFRSAFDSDRGKDTAFITYDQKEKTIIWIRKTSNLLSYVPDKATLRQ